MKKKKGRRKSCKGKTQPQIKWPRETPQVLEKMKAKIAKIIESDAQAKSDFDAFVSRLNSTPDGSVKISGEKAIDLFAIYLMTEPARKSVLPLKKEKGERNDEKPKS